MATLVQNILIHYLPSPPIVYGSTSQDFDFPAYPYSETEAELQWWAVSTFRAPQGTQFSIVPAGIASEPTPIIDATSAAMADLRAVVGAIQEARALPVTPGLDELLARAVQLRGRPNNIEEWARQLATDVGKLTD